MFHIHQLRGVSKSFKFRLLCAHKTLAVLHMLCVDSRHLQFGFLVGGTQMISLCLMDCLLEEFCILMLSFAVPLWLLNCGRKRSNALQGSCWRCLNWVLSDFVMLFCGGPCSCYFHNWKLINTNEIYCVNCDLCRQMQQPVC